MKNKLENNLLMFIFFNFIKIIIKKYQKLKSLNLKKYNLINYLKNKINNNQNNRDQI